MEAARPRLSWSSIEESNEPDPNCRFISRPLVTRLALFYALLSRQVQQLCLALDSRRPNVCDELTIFLIPPLYKLSVQLETDPL